MSPAASTPSVNVEDRRQLQLAGPGGQDDTDAVGVPAQARVDHGDGIGPGGVVRRIVGGTRSAGLLDEYRVCTSPVIKGGGEPLFRPASTGTVELLDTKVFATGAVVHTYGLAASPPAGSASDRDVPAEQG